MTLRLGTERALLCVRGFYPPTANTLLLEGEDYDNCFCARQSD